MLPDGFEWVALGAFGDVWCVRRTDGDRMLCGRLLVSGNYRGFVPVEQPKVPEFKHGRCLAALAGLHGPCRVCGGDVALDGGRVAAHGMWRVGRDGAEQTGEPCPGAGQSPEVSR